MIIGITGVAGSGKDTAAQIISEMTGFKVDCFAKPLHDAAVHIWGKDALSRQNKEDLQVFGEVNFEWFYSWHIKLLQQYLSPLGLLSETNMSKVIRLRDTFKAKTGNVIRDSISPREFMQLYGTEYLRAVDNDIFVKMLKLRVGKNDTIVSDVRFCNEKDICDVLLVIKRDIDSVRQHSSEQMAQALTLSNQTGLIDDTTYIVDNNGTLDDLKNQLSKALDTFNII